MVDVKSPLRFVALLCAGGGFLDSFTWVAHGHVFVNAQTGNIILFGVGIREITGAEQVGRESIGSSGMRRHSAAIQPL
jgi:uncharacterized membrane protein YoaK (UPF0700 family)